VNPDTFPVTLSILLLTGLVIGGLGSLVGVVVGALFIEFVPTFFAQQISKQAPSVVYGLILLAVLMVLPTGAAGLVKTVVGLVTKSLHNRSPTDVGPEIASTVRRRA
jgi:branched-chain amino acid transport system permease protein